MARALSATDRAYHETRSRILDATFAGGDVITEGQIAAALAISRTPVREAFLRLQSEGMLRLYPKRGAVVVPVATEDVVPVMEAREVLETYAIEKILTEHDEAPPELVATLWRHVADMTRQVRAYDVVGYRASDRGFHLAILAAANNPFFEEFGDHLRERQGRLQAAIAPASSERLEQSYREHIAIVEQLERGDLDATLSMLRAHMRAGRQALVNGRPRSAVS